MRDNQSKMKTIMVNPRETTIFQSEVDDMNVVWKYLDKRAGAVAALKDFDSMKFMEHLLSARKNR